MLLSEIRRKAGYETQAAFSLGTGIKRSQIAKWEVGMCYPQAQILPKLADILGCTERDIINAITYAKNIKAKG